MGPKPTAVDQAGRPPRRLWAATSGFQTADGGTSGRDVKPGGGDDGHHVLGGQSVGGQNRPLRRFERDHALEDFGVGRQGAIHTTRATSAGHAVDGQVVRLRPHATMTQACFLRLFSGAPLPGSGGYSAGTVSYTHLTLPTT